MRRLLLFPAGLLAVLLMWRLAPVRPDRDAGRPHYRSPLGIVVDQAGERAYVALHTAGAVAVVDLKAGTVLREIAVGEGPCDLALAGRELFVTCEHSDTLVRIDLAKEAVSGRWRTGQAPRGVAVLPDAGRVFIACHDERTLSVLDLASGGVKSVPLPGWPDRVVPQRGTDLPCPLVLSSRPGEALVSVVSTTDAPRVVQTHKFAGVSNPRGLASTQGAANFILLAHQRPRTDIPTTQVVQGWVFTNAVTWFALRGRELAPGGPSAKVLDDPARAYADPADVVLSPDNRLAFVACAGADAVLALRGDRLDTAAARDDLARSRRYVTARLATQANPRRLALSGDGRTLVVSDYLSDSLTVIDTRGPKVIRHIALGGPEPDAARRGEILFNSAKMTFQGQFSCASCHPDGGGDGLTWDLTRDGVGNFMNTRALWGVRDTAPYGWHGSSPTLADRVTGTLRTLHQHEPQGGQVDDIIAYLRTLEPPRPLPRKSADEAAVVRGKAVFEGKAKCGACHAGPALQDTRPHDVGTRVEGDTANRFDTPSLRGLGRTAPYLHHGRAATLEEVLTTYNPGHRHGAAHALTPEERADLIAYLDGL
jgi:YVTN family beta-propeller protein